MFRGFDSIVQHKNGGIKLMEKQFLIKTAEDFIEHSQDNYITKEIAISDNVVGMRIFEAPIFAFGSADDECFALLKQPSVIGEHFLLPKEWLPGAKTVISFFYPLVKKLKMVTKEICHGLPKNGSMDVLKVRF